MYIYDYNVCSVASLCTSQQEDEFVNEKSVHTLVSNVKLRIAKVYSERARERACSNTHADKHSRTHYTLLGPTHTRVQTNTPFFVGLPALVQGMLEGLALELAHGARPRPHLRDKLLAISAPLQSLEKLLSVREPLRGRRWAFRREALSRCQRLNSREMMTCLDKNLTV